MKKQSEMDASCWRKGKTLDASNAEVSSVSEDGAGGGTRTHTMSPSADFESATSTIPSHRHIFIEKLPKILIGENKERTHYKSYILLYLGSLEKSRFLSDFILPDLLAFESVTSTNSITPALTLFIISDEWPKFKRNLCFRRKIPDSAGRMAVPSCKERKIGVLCL